MKTADLLQVFSALTKPEIRELRQFVASPIFNTREDVAKLCLFLSENGANGFDKTRAAEAIWPGKPFDDKQLRYAMSFLQKTIFEFLTWKELSADAQRNQIHLLRALRKRNLDQHFEKKWVDALDRTDRQPHRHIDHFKRKRQLYLEHTEAAKRHRRDLPFFQEMTDALGLQTLADLLRQGCSLLSHSTVSGAKYDFPLLDAALATVAARPEMLGEPVVAAYFHVHQSMAVADSEPHFRELKTLLATHWAVFPPDESRDLYLFAINFCIKRMNRGEKPFIREAFELYRLGLENRLLLENGQLSPFAYNNILLIALALDEVVWARQFLEEARQFLPEKERENAYQHNLAQFFFRTKDYANAMDLLQKVESREPLRLLESRRMLLRIYFELGEWAALDSLLDSLRVFLYRKKGLGYHQGSHLNLIKMIKKITASDNSDHALLLKEAMDLPVLAEREWVMRVLRG